MAKEKQVKDTATERIKTYLERRAKHDKEFAKMYANPEKSLKDCVQYIKECAQKQASNGAAFIDDDEVYGWAIHYYNEPDVAPKNNVTATMGATEEKPAPKKKATKKAAKVEQSEVSAEDKLLNELDDMLG